MLAFLTTENRLQLVAEANPSNEGSLLQILYNKGSQAEKEIRNLMKKVFSQEIALDFADLQKLRLRIGGDFSSVPADPRDARPIMAQYEKLDEQGDGIRSFLGIVTALLATEKSVFLIDEPETFLHPPQTFRIGEFLANQANDSRQIIIATHSADVLRGILSKTQDVTILRIDRTGNINSFCLLNPNRLKELVTDPLLSSARVLDGLFYAGAVVVEADSDARFYHAASNKRRGDVDLHFVNADNKQTVPRISKMYHDMGVRCVGIVDFDVLNKHEEFIKQLEALALGSKETEEAVAIRKAIALTAKETPPDGRLNDVEQQLDKLLVSIRELRGRNFESEQEAISTKEKLLGQIERKCQEIAASTKAWRPFKEKGRAVLPADLQEKFDHLWEICS